MRRSIAGSIVVGSVPTRVAIGGKRIRVCPHAGSSLEPQKGSCANEAWQGGSMNDQEVGAQMPLTLLHRYDILRAHTKKELCK